MPHYVPAAVTSDRHPSNMSPDAKKKGALLYAGDWATNDVLVYDYPSGKSVGTLTGFDAPYGMCVNAKGDVYIANFYGGTAVEYAHGGTSPLKTYTQVGEPIGCSVEREGRCRGYELQPGWSDRLCRRRSFKRHDVYGPLRFPVDDGLRREGEPYRYRRAADGHDLRMRAAGRIAIDNGAFGMLHRADHGQFPGRNDVGWKVYRAGRSGVRRNVRTGMYQATLSGTTLTMKGSTPLDACPSSYADDVSPFILGKKNTPANHRQAKIAIGADGKCNSGAIGLWHYPAGGGPFKEIGTIASSVVAVSLK